MSTKQQAARQPRVAPGGEREAISSLYRVLDANLNRAQEGCRVVEDVLRHRADDGAPHFRTWKSIRHSISDLRRKVGPKNLLAARRVDRDPGAFWPDEKYETPYHDPNDMLGANLQRLKEALRVIEELGRLLPRCREVSAEAKVLRFKAYRLEKDILFGGRARSGGKSGSKGRGQ